MARIAYRLLTKKEESNYVDAGYTEQEANNIIDFLYDVDEDYTSKKDYVKWAKYYADRVKEKLNIDIDWKLIFDDVTDPNFYSDYRYCSKCGEFFWAGEDCGCDE